MPTNETDQSASDSLSSVLFLDDRADQRELLTAYFVRHKFDVRFARTIDEAVRIQGNGATTCRGCVLFGDVLGESLVTAYDEVLKARADGAIVAVLLPEQLWLRRFFPRHFHRSRTLVLPVSLKTLREEFAEVTREHCEEFVNYAIEFDDR